MPRRAILPMLALLMSASLGSCASGGAHLPSGLIVRHFPAGPADKRQNVVACHSGTRLAIRPHDAFYSGATFDSATSAWQPIPKAPHESDGPSICAGTGILLFGSGGAGAHRGQFLDLRRNSWQQLPESPLGSTPPVASVAMGRYVFAFSPVGGHIVGERFDTFRGTWQVVPSPPDEVTPDLEETYVPVATDHHIVLLVARHIDQDVRYLPLRYEPTRHRWTTMSMSPNLPVHGVSSTGMGDSVVVFGEALRSGTETRRGIAHLSGVKLDVTSGKWTSIARPLVPGYSEDDGSLDVSRWESIRTASTGSTLLVWTGIAVNATDLRVPVMAYSVEHDRWVTLGFAPAKYCCGYPESAAVWTGHEMVLYFQGGPIAVAPKTP